MAIKVLSPNAHGWLATGTLWIPSSNWLAWSDGWRHLWGGFAFYISLVLAKSRNGIETGKVHWEHSWFGLRFVTTSDISAFLCVSLPISSLPSGLCELNQRDYNWRVHLGTFCLLVLLKSWVKIEESLKATHALYKPFAFPQIHCPLGWFQTNKTFQSK